MDNDRLGIIITACCLLLVVITMQWSGMSKGGYVVEPYSPQANLTDTSGADGTIGFWDLPPRVMLISVLLSISPLLVSPVELLFLLKGFTFLGYRKITTVNVLQSHARFLIYATIKASPGMYFNEISRKTGVKRGSLTYHLTLLKITGKITSVTIGSDTRYFENSGRFVEIARVVLKYLRDDKDYRILGFLMNNSRTTRKDLEKHLEISGAAVTWHMNRLREAGILTVTRAGRSVQYAITPEAHQYLRKYLPVPGEKTRQSFEKTGDDSISSPVQEQVSPQVLPRVVQPDDAHNIHVPLK